MEAAIGDVPVGNGASSAVPPRTRWAEKGVEGCAFSVGWCLVHQFNVDDLHLFDSYGGCLELGGSRLRVPGIERKLVYVSFVREMERHEYQTGPQCFVDSDRDVDGPTARRDLHHVVVGERPGCGIFRADIDDATRAQWRAVAARLHAGVVGIERRPVVSE